MEKQQTSAPTPKKPKQRKQRFRFKFRQPSRRQIFALELIVFLVILFIFGAKTANYFGVEALKPSELFDGPKQSLANGFEYIRQHRLVGRCPDGTKKIVVDWSYVCRKDTESNQYVTIFDTYDKLGRGREYIYNDINRGDMEVAELLVRENKYDFKRYEASQIISPTWTEDPYNDRYWRFSYYSLQIVDDLLFAYQETGDKVYAERAIALMNDFIDHGQDKVHSWDDYHGVAFRTMTMINAWWKLREANLLDIDTSNKVLAALEKHGEFLSDRAHHEANHNHGVNEAASLYLLGSVFPTLPNAQKWHDLGASRIAATLHDLIDADGVLIENSPFYHFYVLGKYWEIYQYSQKRNDQISPVFKEKIDKMVNYAVHVLQPNTRVPTIGASLDSQVFYNAEFKQLAKAYPQLKYVITQSEYGKRPASPNAYFPEAGQAVMRSDFGRNFEKQAQVIFQTSGYRTKHSHLDALSVDVTEGSDRLLVDPGLYSYEEDPVSNYFESTSAHNTVMVDGKDQRKGESKLVHHSEGQDFANATAAHELFEGVNHSRSVSLLNKRTIVVIDKLSSKSDHTYTQMWHFAPGANVTKEGEGVMRATYPGRKDPLIIRQMQPVDGSQILIDKQEGMIAGVCSNEYKKLLSCPQGNFTKRGEEVTFVTTIELDGKQRGYNFDANAQTLFVRTPGAREFTLNIQTVPAVDRKFTGNTIDRTITATNDRPRIAMLFTDGSSTIDYVLPIMHQNGHKASLAVPGQHIDNFFSDTLTPYEMQTLQNIYGWDLINYTYERVPAISEYIAKQELPKFEADVMRGAAALEKHGLKANHNWFMYPSDSYAPETKEIIGKYYRFGIVQAETTEPTLPFADPLAVRTYTVDSDTTFAQVQQVIDQAVANNQTLILNFKRIKRSQNPLEPGYNIEDFQRLMQNLSAANLRTMSLTELDASLGVSSNQPAQLPRIPAYSKVDISATTNRRNIWDYLFH